MIYATMLPRLRARSSRLIHIAVYISNQAEHSNASNPRLNVRITCMHTLTTAPRAAWPKG